MTYVVWNGMITQSAVLCNDLEEAVKVARDRTNRLQLEHYVYQQVGYCELAIKPEATYVNTPDLTSPKCSQD